jgi:16S rRNA processing protein RimM
MEELVAIARIVRTRGLKGEVVGEVLTDFPERFEALDTVIGVGPNSERAELIIETSWFQSGRIILKFRGYDTIDKGEELRNWEVCVPESEVVDLESGEYFDWQLEGCVVEDLRGETIVELRKLLRTGGPEILVVAGPVKEYLIPFSESICVDVDIDKKVIRIDPPEGLLEF